MVDFAAAEAGIRKLHARYTDAVWRQDCDAFAECFTEDGEWRISGMVLRGRPAIRETIARILDRFNRVLITFRTPILELGADGQASARTYIDERCSWKNGETNISIGCYYEHFVAAGDRWLFDWRLFEMHYRGPPDLSGTWYDHPDHGPPPAMPPRDAPTPDMATARWGLVPPGT
jgi:ketosteroid isomerase-like protein